MQLVTDQIQGAMVSSSFIRKMFERGLELKRQFGEVVRIMHKRRVKMEKPSLELVLLLVCALSVGDVKAGSFAGPGDCRATWDDATLTVGNSLFSRSWRSDGNVLRTVSFGLSNAERSFVAGKFGEAKGPSVYASPYIFDCGESGVRPHRNRPEYSGKKV